MNVPIGYYITMTISIIIPIIVTIVIMVVIFRKSNLTKLEKIIIIIVTIAISVWLECQINIMNGTNIPLHIID